MQSFTIKVVASHHLVEVVDELMDRETNSKELEVFKQTHDCVSRLPINVVGGNTRSTNLQGAAKLLNLLWIVVDGFAKLNLLITTHTSISTSGLTR
jgi:hypothetical protein